MRAPLFRRVALGVGLAVVVTSVVVAAVLYTTMSNAHAREVRADFSGRMSHHVELFQGFLGVRALAARAVADAASRFPGLPTPEDFAVVRSV